MDALPERTQRAMLRGISRNRIIVGAYTDPRSGGICPMLAAHRNGGRTSLGSFAVAWDAFTGARKPRLATRREVRTLRSYLEISLLRSDQDDSVAALAARLRTERASATPAPRHVEESSDTSLNPPTPDSGSIRIHRTPDTRRTDLRDRLRFTWMNPDRRREEFTDLLTAAHVELADQRTTELLGTSPDAGNTPH